MPPTPFAKRILDAVVPTVARWLVGLMRRLEEDIESPAARWEILRQRLEGIGRGQR